MHLMPRNLMITFGLSIIICWVVRLKYRGTICNDVGVVVYIHRHVYIDFHRDNDNDDDDNGAFSANGLVCQCPCSLFLYLMKCHLASQRPLSSVLPVSLWRFSTLFTYYFVFDCHSACRSILNTYVATALAKIPYSRWIKRFFFLLATTRSKYKRFYCNTQWSCLEQRLFPGADGHQGWSDVY